MFRFFNVFSFDILASVLIFLVRIIFMDVSNSWSLFWISLLFWKSSFWKYAQFFVKQDMTWNVHLFFCLLSHVPALTQRAVRENPCSLQAIGWGTSGLAKATNPGLHAEVKEPVQVFAAMWKTQALGDLKTEWFLIRPARKYKITLYVLKHWKMPQHIILSY